MRASLWFRDLPLLIISILSTLHPCSHIGCIPEPVRGLKLPLIIIHTISSVKHDGAHMAFVSMLIHNHSSHYRLLPLSCGFTRCVPYYHDITLSIICQPLRGIFFYLSNKVFMLFPCLTLSMISHEIIVVKSACRVTAVCVMV